MFTSQHLNYNSGKVNKAIHFNYLTQGLFCKRCVFSSKALNGLF